MECLQRFAELSPEEYGANEQCPKCESQRKRSCSTAPSVGALDRSLGDYDMWIEQDKLSKLQWPKVRERENLKKAFFVPPAGGRRIPEPRFFSTDDASFQNATDEESLVRACGYPRELGSLEATPQEVEYRHIERAAPYYQQFLHSQGMTHYIYIIIIIILLFYIVYFISFI